MASATILTLKNAAATAVSYAVQKILAGNFIQWNDRSAINILGQSKASLECKETPTVRKVNGKLVYPTLDAITGAVVRTHLGTFELVAPLTGSKVERQEFEARFRAMILDAVVTAAFEDGDMPY